MRRFPILPVRSKTPPLILTQRGVSLLELLVVTILVAGVLLSMSLLFPKTLKVTHQNRQRLQATTLAQNHLQRLKAEKYALIDTTPKTVFPGAPPICNCSIADLSTLLPSPSATFTETGVFYEIRSCINITASDGTPYCAEDLVPMGIDDPGLKNIRVQIRWMENNQYQSINLQSQVARL